MRKVSRNLSLLFILSTIININCVAPNAVKATVEKDAVQVKPQVLTEELNLAVDNLKTFINKKKLVDLSTEQTKEIGEVKKLVENNGDPPWLRLIVYIIITLVFILIMTVLYVNLKQNQHIKRISQGNNGHV